MPNRYKVSDTTLYNLGRKTALHATAISNLHVHTDDCVHLNDLDLQCIWLVVEGLQNKQIAHRLHRSPRTIRNRLSIIYRALRIQNGRAGLITFAFKAKLVT